MAQLLNLLISIFLLEVEFSASHRLPPPSSTLLAKHHNSQRFLQGNFAVYL